MFQNSFIWKNIFWQKGHGVLFYNNLVGSLYPICTLQWHCNNLHWIISISEIYLDPLVIDLVRDVVPHTSVVIKNLFVIIVDGIPFIPAHLGISCCFGFCSCLHVLYNLVPLLGYKNLVSLRIHNFFLMDILFLLTINQYKKLIWIPIAMIVMWTTFALFPFPSSCDGEVCMCPHERRSLCW
jgi:hypothetical protein